MVGGVYGLYNLLPFIIEIFFRVPNKSDQHHCGAALISHEWVLTAAHCVQNKNLNIYYLGAGRTKKSQITTDHGIVRFDFGQTRRVADIICHGQYDKETFFNDIALMKPRAPFKDTFYLSPIALPSKTEKGDLSQLFKYCYSGGWGISGSNIMLVYNHSNQNWTYNTDYAKSSTKLMHVVLPLISNEQCRRLHYRDIFVGFDVITTQICTLYYPGRKAMCRGDSGGPLICGSMIYGVSSWSYSCGAPRIGADVFTRVDKFLDWINQTMAKHPYRRRHFDKNEIDNAYSDMGDMTDFRSAKGTRNVPFIFILVFYYLLLFLIM